MLLALLHLHGYRVIDGGRPTCCLGITDTGARTVTLYTDDVAASLAKKVLAYETGHVLDVSCLSRRQRSDWQRWRHLHGTWYAPDLAPENGYGSGDFADVYSAWATGRAWAQGRLPSSRNMKVLAGRFHFKQGVCLEHA